MTKDNPHTFVLMAKAKKRFVAGPYDRAKNLPRYRAEVSAPEQVKYLIQQNQFLLQQGDEYFWTWDFENQSDSPSPAFIIVTKDGVVIPENEAT